MFDLFDELASVAGALTQAGVRHALVGGLAYCVWVEARNTEDIDLLIAPEDWEKVKAALDPLGYEDLGTTMDFENARIRRLTKIEGPQVLVLDFVLADAPYREGLDRCVRLKHGGKVFCVAPPDLVIALKRGRMSDKDRLDIQGLERFIKGETP